MELKIEGLSKRYSAHKYGLRDFSMNLENGIVGLLGPNGAGKSTLMRIIATISRPSAGKVTLDGTDLSRDPNALRRVLGYLPQDFGVYPNLNAVEFLDYIAAVKGLSGNAVRIRIESLLSELNLLQVRKQPLGTYSGGMKQRIGIAQALLNDPKILVLDEPTVGLDPEERVRFRNLLSHFSGDRIVILSSHIVSDIETIAGDIVIMNEGRLLARGITDQILTRVEGRVFEALINAGELEAFKSRHRLSNFVRRPEGWLVRYVSAHAVSPPEPGSRPVRPILEDAYLDIVSAARG